MKMVGKSVNKQVGKEKYMKSIRDQQKRDQYTYLDAQT